MGKLRPKGRNQEGNTELMCSPKPLPLSWRRRGRCVARWKYTQLWGCQPRAQLGVSPARHWGGRGGTRHTVGRCGERGREEAANGRRPGRRRPPCVPLQGPGAPPPLPSAFHGSRGANTSPTIPGGCSDNRLLLRKRGGSGCRSLEARGHYVIPNPAQW